MKTRIGVALLATMLLGVSPMALAQKAGGAIDVATIGEPPTLDPMASTADLVGIITQHFFETLYTFGEGWKITPLLAADRPSISADGKEYIIPLRTGVKFHDGSTMTPADVVASLKRWTEVAVRGKQAAAEIASIEAGTNSVKITLKQPFAPLLALLSLNNSAAVIMPASKAVPQLTEFVGTGPYKFKERQPDRYILVEKFADYSARTDRTAFYGGKRTAYVDQIRFVPVPNANTRIEGALAGQYTYADSLPVESYDRFKGQAKSEGMLVKPFGWPVMFFNTKEGALAKEGVRRALVEGISYSDMLEAAFGSKDFYEPDGSLYPKGYEFHSEEGTKSYTVADPAKAKADAKAAGYDGKPVRILTSMQYEFHYKMAQVAAEYMKQAGFAVDMQVVDWATLTQRRNDPALWDIYFTHSPFLPEPALNSMMNNNAPGWWATPEKDALVKQINTEADPDKRAKLMVEFQKLVYQQVPIQKVGNFNAVAGKSKGLKGVTPAPWPFFWNAWVE